VQSYNFAAPALTGEKPVTQVTVFLDKAKPPALAFKKPITQVIGFLDRAQPGGENLLASL
jgi:hypothetical protein